MIEKLFILLDDKVISSLVFLFLMFLVRWLVIYLLKKQATDAEGESKRWINASKNTTYLIIFLGLLIIWLSELRFVALSIAAFAVAIVVATKEFIMCLIGHVYLAIAGPFRVGDWVSTGNFTGEVISNDWLSTRLQEIDIANKTYVYTGKTIFIPNSQLLTVSVTNLNHMRRYVEHTFSLFCDPAKHKEINITQINELLLQKASTCCADFKEVAKRYNSLIENRLGVTLQDAETSVRISTTETGNYVFTFSLFCPTQQAQQIEQVLTQLFIENLQPKEG